jgi:hypothetical protein
MDSLSNSRRSVVVVVSIICIFAPPLAAQTMEPPFFGPPGVHANTLSGLVDDDGTPGPSAGDSVAYFGWGGSEQPMGSIETINPWQECALNATDFVLHPYMSGGGRQGIYDSFENTAWYRGFYFDNYDNDGNPVGGTYWSEDGSAGTATLEMTDPNHGNYDQIRIQSLEPGRQLDILLPLVTHHGDGADFIGVGNIASLGVIGPCGNADANTDIMIPLGSHNGAPAIIFDLEGDGSPTVGFLPSAPVGVRQQQTPAIPTLSGWGFAVLAVSLLAIGLMILRWSGATVSI